MPGKPRPPLGFLASLTNKQTYKQGLRWILGAIFLEFQKKIPGQVVVNLSSCPGKASGERKQLCFKTCPYEHPPQGREPDFRERVRKPTVPEDVYLGYGWHLKERDRKEKKNRKLQLSIRTQKGGQTQSWATELVEDLVEGRDSGKENGSVYLKE